MRWGDRAAERAVALFGLDFAEPVREEARRGVEEAAAAVVVGGGVMNKAEAEEEIADEDRGGEVIEGVKAGDVDCRVSSVLSADGLDGLFGMFPHLVLLADERVPVVPFGSSSSGSSSFVFASCVSSPSFFVVIAGASGACL